MDLRELLIKQDISEEQADLIVKSMKDNKLFVTKEENIEQRYEKLKEQKVELEGQVSERDKQLEDLKSKASGSDELKQQIQQLQDTNKETLEKYEAKLQEQGFDFALETALKDNKVKNTKAVRALLNSEDIKLDGKSLIGLDEQIKVLKESDPYLFEEKAEKNDSGGLGNFGRREKPGEMTRDEFNSLGYKERIKLKSESPELYNKLTTKER